MNFSDNERISSNEKADRLRALEHSQGAKLDDWHYALLPQFDDPVHLFAWFKGAKKSGERIYFNANEKSGVLAYDWVKTKYIGHLLKAFGKIELCLAKDGVIIKSFNPYEKVKKNGNIMKILEDVA